MNKKSNCLFSSFILHPSSFSSGTVMTRRYQTEARGPWLKPLRILARAGWTDSAIAWCLSRLPRHALFALLRMDDPTDDDITALACPDPVDHWTAGMVKWHRWTRAIPSRVPRYLSLASWWARGQLQPAS